MVSFTEISEQSSSSSLPTSSFDVFLSFRGKDTRYGFTDHLLKALLDATIETFFDDTKIPIGDFLKPELESAIKSSRASVIVLSKNYASSAWCLEELALIMEQRRTSKHIVFPIFYHVKPSDVKKQRNSFGEAMAEHKQRLETETNEEKRSQRAQKIEQWEKALREVADLKGEETDGSSRRETILIEGIVEEISSRLDLHKRSEIPKLFGMDSSLQTVTSFLKDGSGQSTEFLTIWGMAGIGKTFLANYVFKLHCDDFERSCFIEDIERRCTPPNGLLDLQKQLLKDIKMRSWVDIIDVDVATLKIEKLLLRKRTLVVLDGINNFEQLDVLIGTKGLHPGSKIIITSKDGSLTEKCRLFETQVPPKHMKHLLNGLDEDESLKLLSWHAFRHNEPNDTDKKFSMKVVQYCQGHPLALKVLGSSFRHEDTTWEDILESLGKEINPHIKEVLKISFDTLPSEKDKELFKHIACLFVGEDKKFTEEVLKACGICKSSGIKVLINRCLLTIGSNDELMMHQLLQDIGRDIVLQESSREPWKRSILWHHEECLDVLQNRQGTPLIQGLVLDMRTCESDTSKELSSVDMQKFGSSSYSLFKWIHILLLSVLWFLFGRYSGMCSSSHKRKGNFEILTLSDMRNLRLLQLNYVQLTGSYKNFPQGLRWLCMQGLPLSYIPSDLQMENMVALDMSNSKLQQLWKKPKLLKSLKFLNLSSCYELVRVGHFSGLPLLERLTLARCTSLVEVCESIGASCKKLEVLDLSKCNKLKELPRSIGKLKNLTQLLIDGCSNICEFPVEMKDMESLRVLKANNINMKSHGSCTSTMVLRSSKSIMSYLPRSLVKLSLMDCNLHNESFPKDFSSLSMLKELYLTGNPIDSMPDCVRSLKRLENLNLYRCYNLKKILCAPVLLQKLIFTGCGLLEKVTFDPKMAYVPIYNYFGTHMLTEIQHQFKIQDLSEIDEEVLHNLGWINIEYLNRGRFFKTYVSGVLDTTQRTIPVPAQVLYEHGIFSTYLQGHRVPKWFTHRSSSSLFTLQSSPKLGKIRGLNVCIVRTVSSYCTSMKDVGLTRIEIRNLTKNSSWIYQPFLNFIPENDEFESGDEVVVVWLSHWMFGKNEFEDGDEVSIRFSVLKSDYHNGDPYYTRCGDEGLDNANVREYGISLVYEDEGGNQKEDPLGYYKSWKNIIGGDLSAYEASSCHYRLIR